MNLNFCKKIYSGKLITFCGLDGSGKTTLIGLLNEYLKANGISPIITKQPTNAVRNSTMFRTYMDAEDHTAFDYRALSLNAAADRIQHTNKFIEPRLEKGEIVISDRYYYSCLANHRARGYNDPWIYQVSEYIQTPDLSFFIDVDVDTAINRIRQREQEKNKYIDVDLQYELRDQYLMIAEECGGIVISSTAAVNRCFEEVVNHVYPILKKMTEGDSHDRNEQAIFA
ncbi:thymidylate kinase [Clostridia bacterium]|nr:thymidylate kinase [Clostridia bacterium]